MDFQHIQAGVRLLATSISGITSIIGDCEQTQADLDAFENWAKVFLHPKQLKPIVQKNLKDNLVALTFDLKKAKKFLKN